MAVAAWTVAAVAVVSLAVVLSRAGSFLDLEAYLAGAAAIADGKDPYAPQQGVLPFVYPPFAALLFLPLTWTPAAAPTFMSIASLAALARISWLLAVRLDSGRGSATVTKALLVFTALALLEPSVETWRLGQVSLILLWLVAEDGIGDQRRTRGVATGLAAAIKVVPMFFLVYYLVVGRYRTAVLGAITLTVLTAVTFLLLPEESFQYWFVDLMDASRVGAAIDFVSNQSLLGVWARTFGQDPSSTLWWRLAMIGVAGLALVIARQMWQRNARLLSFGIAGLAVLLVSPISWTHHWVFFYPLVVGLAGYWSVRWVRVPVIVAVVVLFSPVVWRAPHEGGGNLAMEWFWWPVANAYVLVGVMIAVTSVMVVWRVLTPALAVAPADAGQGTTVSPR